MNFDDDTPSGKVRLIAKEEVASEVNGFFVYAEKYVKRARLLGGIALAIASAGFVFGIWKSTLVTRPDIERLEGRIDAVELQGMRTNASLDRLERMFQQFRWRASTKSDRSRIIERIP